VVRGVDVAGVVEPAVDLVAAGDVPEGDRRLPGRLGEGGKQVGMEPKGSTGDSVD
jgi:hypothetical protein